LSAAAEDIGKTIDDLIRNIDTTVAIGAGVTVAFFAFPYMFQLLGMLGTAVSTAKSIIPTATGTGGAPTTALTGT
jgi:hypothetical protein